jgi:hypothetical protein
MVENNLNGLEGNEEEENNIGNMKDFVKNLSVNIKMINEKVSPL